MPTEKVRHGFTATPWWAIAWTAVGLALVGGGGYLGGRLAYHYGVRVATPDHQAEGYQPLPAGRRRSA